MKQRRAGMKVKNIKDVDAFFKMIDQCVGAVELVTDEGDRLNLKSKLCQIVALAGVFSCEAIPEMELIAEEQEDAVKIVEFMGQQS